MPRSKNKGPVAVSSEKLPVSEVQFFRLQEAVRHSTEVLREVKSRQLYGKDLKAMKTLEEAVQQLEVFTFALVEPKVEVTQVVETRVEDTGINPFNKDDSVIISKEGIEAKIHPPGTTGKVVTQPSKSNIVCVRRDGKRMSNHYNIRVWEKADKQEMEDGR